MGNGVISSVSETDMQSLEGQLGRPVSGKVGVSSYCPFGRPRVIRTAPSGGFFTASLYWLTCPWLVKQVSRLEGGGGLAEVASMLDSGDGGFTARYLSCLASYMEEAASILKSAGLDLPQTGVDGCRNPMKVKCLHSQVAHHIALGEAGSGENPVGEWALSRFDGSSCEKGRCDQE